MSDPATREGDHRAHPSRRAAGPEYGGYVNASKAGHPVAGLMYNDPQWNSPDGWTTYLHTADINATLSAATSAGATNLR